MEPLSLPANQPPKFYRGGPQIASFRGDPPDVRPLGSDDRFAPEDWIASTVASDGTDTDGVTLLPDGTPLRDAISADPLAYLSPAQFAAFGPNPGLLVKLLDAGERLPVHCHPDRAFASSHLGCAFGKTEAWLIVGTEGPDPHVYLGFNRDVELPELDKWFEEQDSVVILSAMNKVAVNVGDTILVPAGTPHAIGAGLFIIELQEPTDFSVMLEWKNFGLPERHDSQLGMSVAQSLQCFNRLRLTTGEIANLHRRAGAAAEPGVTTLLPPSATPFFQAEEAVVDGSHDLEAGYSILIVLDGAGTVQTANSSIDVARGSTVLIPYSAGTTTLRGQLRAVRCLPPASQGH
jgi:mannose-6-phosphate isomerase